MIALAPLVVVADLAHAQAAVEQRRFEAMTRWRHRPWNTPDHHFDDRSIVIVDALVKKQFRFHLDMMA